MRQGGLFDEAELRRDVGILRAGAHAERVNKGWHEQAIEALKVFLQDHYTPRVDGEGTRQITRYEQRAYAEQLRRSPHRAMMEHHAGKEAFEHYLRKDRTGGRAIPPEHLEHWITNGWLTRVEPPDVTKWPAVRPCIVLDPFGGSGTTGQVAVSLNRNAVCLDLAYTESYGRLAQNRTSNVQRELTL